MKDFGSILRGDTGYSAQNSGGIIVLAQTAVPVSITGTTAETELGRIIIPGGLLGPNGVIELTPVFSMTGNVNVKLLAVRFGGVQVIFANLNQASQVTIQQAVNIRNRNSLSSQMLFLSTVTPYGTSGGNIASFNVNTAVDQVLSITATLGVATDIVTLEAYTVKILNPL